MTEEEKLLLLRGTDRAKIYEIFDKKEEPREPDKQELGIILIRTAVVLFAMMWTILIACWLFH